MRNMIKNIAVIVFALLFSLGNTGYVLAQEVLETGSVEETVKNETFQVIEQDGDLETQNGSGEQEIVEVDSNTIASCEDVYNSSDLLVYLQEFDGDPDCSYNPEVAYLAHYNIFPGESVAKVVRVSIDGVEYSLENAPNFKIQTIDETVGFVVGEFSFPQDFPNWEGDDFPVATQSLMIELTFHNSCESIVGSAEVLLEYLSRFNSAFTLICELQTTVIDVQDEVVIEKGSDLLAQITVTIDGIKYTLSDLDFLVVLDGFTSENTGEFVVSVGAGKDGVTTVEDVVVTVVDSSVQEETSNGGGGSNSSSGTLTNGGTGTGQVLGAFDTAGEVLGESITGCPVFSSFHKKGDRNGEVDSIQEFLNTHMNAGLAVDGVYGLMTEKAVHAFQQKYWDQTIKPWTPVLSSRTTGRWYKTTNAWANVLSGCSVEPVLIEDTGAMYTPSLEGFQI